MLSLKEVSTRNKMREFEDMSWDDEWEKVLENRGNNPNREKEKATKKQLKMIYKKLKGGS